MAESYLMPFGKYKGQPVDILAADPEYREWVSGQSWLKEKHPQIYAFIVNNFQEPEETPEHNALQALFLDDTLCLAVAKHVARKTETPIDVKRTRFESDGIDVVMDILADKEWICKSAKVYLYGCDEHPSGGVVHLSPDNTRVALELKTSLGDDYPAVLRQALSIWRVAKEIDYIAVIIQKYAGARVPFEQVREIFRHSGIHLLLLDEVLHT